MKAYFVLLCSLIPSGAFAYAQAQFTGNVGMITITDRYGTEIVDDDPVRLFNSMDVPVQEQGIWRSKHLKLSDNSFTLLCQLRKGAANNCMLIVRSGPNGTVAKEENLIRFHATGDLARELHAKFPSATGRFEFVTSDGYFRLLSDSESFLAEYRVGP